ncbi:hypothetical protein [Edaphobacter aggregans]|uniref:hypothetical protein n=1 Tax=Edaphobacter aggregans TaxID=570835 RepID=UPI00055733E1|nr:hypothetical protein [Edaphobacter aggregans]
MRGAVARAGTSPYSFRQSFCAFSEYSNTSSRIVLGAARDRRLVAIGLTYSRRLLHTRYADWNYAPELLPFVLIEDPVANLTVTVFFPLLVESRRFCCRS